MCVCSTAQEKRRRGLALASFQTAVTGGLPVFRNVQRPGEAVGLGQVDPLRQSFSGVLSSQSSLGNPLVEGLQNLQGNPGGFTRVSMHFFKKYCLLYCMWHHHDRNHSLVMHERIPSFTPAALLCTSIESILPAPACRAAINSGAARWIWPDSNMAGATRRPATAPVLWQIRRLRRFFAQHTQLLFAVHRIE